MSNMSLSSAEHLSPNVGRKEDISSKKMDLETKASAYLHTYMNDVMNAGYNPEKAGSEQSLTRIIAHSFMKLPMMQSMDDAWWNKTQTERIDWFIKEWKKYRKSDDESGNLGNIAVIKYIRNLHQNQGLYDYDLFIHSNKCLNEYRSNKRFESLSEITIGLKVKSL